MGTTQSKLSPEMLERLEKRTFFTKKEILLLFNKFEALGGALDKPLDADVLLKTPQLAINPFRHRIVHVFSGSNSDDGKLLFSFEDYLQLVNAFSARASLEVKAYWAFKIYDYDGDNFIDRSDIVNILRAIVGEKKLSLEEMRKVAQRVLDEADLDGNNKLSRTEFMRTIYRLPDFASKFQFSVDV